MIKKVMLAMVLLSGINGAFAEMSDFSITNNTHESALFPQSVIDNVALQGDSDVSALKEILTSNSFYRMLLAMNAEVPEIARVGEYVTLLNEMHLMNQKLMLIAAEMQKANQMQANHLNDGGRMNG